VKPMPTPEIKISGMDEQDAENIEQVLTEGGIKPEVVSRE